MSKSRFIVGILALLGFGTTLGLGSGCAHRAQKSRTSESGPQVDTLIVDSLTIRVMYGVQLTPFDPDKPLPERVVTE